MAITTYGFDGTINEAQWAQLFGDAMSVAPNRDGVVSGLVASPAAGARQVSVSAGRAVGPGVGAVSDAPVTVTLDAGTTGQGRVDLIALELNWSTNTGTIKAVKGTPKGDESEVAPTPTRNAGVLWQIPLATVEIGPTTGTLTAGLIESATNVSDTGWVATTPAGNWSRATPNGLAVRRQGNRVTLNGRLLLSADAATRTVGNEYPLSGLRIIPASFTPAREVFTSAWWDIGNGTNPPGHALVRIDEAGFGYVAPYSKNLTAGKTIRIHTTWEV